MRRSDAGLLFAATDVDGGRATVELAAAPLTERRARARFRRFASLRAGLDHPGTLPVRQVGEHRGVPYVVMDAYPNRTLIARLDNGPLPPAEVLRLLAPAADALDAAHSIGLVHQTLGADSLLLTRRGAVLDAFGVTYAAHDSLWHALREGSQHLRYGPLEELREEPIGPESNVYSFAGLLVHALTGKPPFDGEPERLLHAHLVDPRPRPSERVAELPAALDEVVGRGMAVDALRRPRSNRELIDAAADALELAPPPSRKRIRPAGPGAQTEPSRTGPRFPRRTAKRERASKRALTLKRAPAPDRAPARERAAATEQALGTERASAAKRAPAAERAADRTTRRFLGLGVVSAAAAIGIVAGLLANPFEPGDWPPRVDGIQDAQAIQRLDDRRLGLRVELASASTPDEQAAAARALADAYRDAAAAAATPALSRAASRASASYEDLVAATAAEDPERFAEAARAIERTERAVTATAANASG